MDKIEAFRKMSEQSFSFWDGSTRVRDKVTHLLLIEILEKLEQK